MAIFKNIFRRFRFWKRTNTESASVEHDLTKTLKRYEFYVYKTQHILLWENPSETLFIVAVVNLLFWLFASLEWRFYGIVFTGLLITTLHELWTREIWPEIRVKDPTPIIDNYENDILSDDNPQHESLVRLSKFLSSSQKFIKDYYSWLKNLREKRPGIFCCVMTGIFFSLSFVGRIIPGLVLVYLIVMFALFAPGFWVHIVPPDAKKSIVTRLSAIHQMIYHTSDDLPSEEEYLPDATNDDLSLLSEFVQAENLNEDVNNSRGSSLTHLSINSNIMPSHDDVSIDSLPGLSDMDLNLPENNLLLSDKSNIVNPEADDFSDDSSIANDLGIDFQSTHFNGDESSSEEEEKLFTKDLKFNANATCTNVIKDIDDNQHELSSLDDKNIDLLDVSSSRTGRKLSPSKKSDVQPSISNFIADNLMGLSNFVGQSYFLTNIINRNSVSSSSNRNESNKTLVKNESSDSLISDEDFEMIDHEELS